MSSAAAVADARTCDAVVMPRERLISLLFRLKECVSAVDIAAAMMEVLLEPKSVLAALMTPLERNPTPFSDAQSGKEATPTPALAALVLGYALNMLYGVYGLAPLIELLDARHVQQLTTLLLSDSAPGAAAACFALNGIDRLDNALLSESFCQADVLAALLTVAVGSFNGVMDFYEATAFLLLRRLIERWPALARRIFIGHEVLDGCTPHLLSLLLHCVRCVGAAHLLCAAMQSDAILAREVATAHAEALLPAVCEALHNLTAEDKLHGAAPVVDLLQCLIVAVPAAHTLLQRRFDILERLVKEAVTLNAKKALEAHAAHPPVLQALKPLLTDAGCAPLIAGLMRRVDGGNALLAAASGYLAGAAHTFENADSDAAVASAERLYTRQCDRATRLGMDSDACEDSFRLAREAYGLLAAAAHSPQLPHRARTMLMRANAMARATLFLWLHERDYFDRVMRIGKFGFYVRTPSGLNPPRARTTGLQAFGLPELHMEATVPLATHVSDDVAAAFAGGVCLIIGQQMLHTQLARESAAAGSVCGRAGCVLADLVQERSMALSLDPAAAGALASIMWRFETRAVTAARSAAAKRAGVPSLWVGVSWSSYDDDQLLSTLTDVVPAPSDELLCSMGDSLIAAGAAGDAVVRALEALSEVWHTHGHGDRCACCLQRIAARLLCALPGCKALYNEAELKRCAACSRVAYCCKDHQVADWPRHRPECKAARKALKAAQGAA